MINPVSFFSLGIQRKQYVFEGRHSHHVRKNPRNVKNIAKRMGLHSSAYKLNQPVLVAVDVGKFDSYYSQDAFYLSSDFTDESCDDFVKYLSSGDSIESPFMKLSEEDGKLHIGCIDGRHRYKVLKEMGMKVMPITMSQESKRLADKYGLVIQI